MCVQFVSSYNLVTGEFRTKAKEFARLNPSTVTFTLSSIKFTIVSLCIKICQHCLKCLHYFQGFKMTRSSVVGEGVANSGQTATCKIQYGTDKTCRRCFFLGCCKTCEREWEEEEV